MLLRIKQNLRVEKVSVFDKEFNKFSIDFNEDTVFLKISDISDNYSKILFGGNLYYISNFFTEEV